MSEGQENIGPFMVWLQRDVDADLIELISDAATHRRGSAEIRRLLRLGLAADVQLRDTELTDAYWIGPDCQPADEEQPVAGYNRAVFIFGDIGTLGDFRDQLHRRGIRVPAVEGGYRQYIYPHTGTIGWPVLVTNLREGFIYELTDECGFFTTDPFDEPTDGPVSFEQFYGMLDLLKEIAAPGCRGLPARAMLEDPNPYRSGDKDTFEVNQESRE